MSVQRQWNDFAQIAHLSANTESVEGLYCKNPKSNVWRLLKYWPLPPHRPASVYGGLGAGGGHTLARGRGGGRSIDRMTPDTALNSKYVSTLWLIGCYLQQRENSVRDTKDSVASKVHKYVVKKKHPTTCTDLGKAYVFSWSSMNCAVYFLRCVFVTMHFKLQGCKKYILCYIVSIMYNYLCTMTRDKNGSKYERL